jgi:hypothetical protein
LVYGDFSRLFGGLLGHYSGGPYSGVLAQQGRLLLDAELNEQNAILLDYLRGLTTDLIGPFAGPIHHAGFKVEPVVQNANDLKCRAVRLGRGHYYVYGLRCEAPVPHHRADEELPIGEHEVPFLVYLVVWEQAVSAIQAPELIDPALSAAVPDTTRRSQVRWRPVAGRRLPMRDEELTKLDDREAILSAFHEYNADPHRRPTLGARAHSGAEPEPGPATAPTPWGYRRVENQLYRVEVHRGGKADEATFKWSRDNGSVEFGLAGLNESTPGTRTATLQRAWYDTEQGLEVGDWVEFVDDRWAPLGTPPALMQVQGITLATRSVTLQDSEASRHFDPALHPLLRRWDQRPDGQAPNHGIPVGRAHRRWCELEDGVQIRFEAPEAHYERGDFWLIPARTATSGVLWPQSRDAASPGPLAIPPEGPPRYLAPLALLRQLDDPFDLRVLFGYRAEHHAGPEAHEPAVRHESLPTAATTVIRAAGVAYRLRSVSTFEPGAFFPVQDGTVIGRSVEAGIRFDHPDVSRHHAAFRLSGATLTVADLGSTNGTFVNGNRLTAGTAATLQPGDTVQIGSPELQFQVEAV